MDTNMEDMSVHGFNKELFAESKVVIPEKPLEFTAYPEQGLYNDALAWAVKKSNSIVDKFVGLGLVDVEDAAGFKIMSNEGEITDSAVVANTEEVKIDRPDQLRNRHHRIYKEIIENLGEAPEDGAEKMADPQVLKLLEESRYLDQIADQTVRNQKDITVEFAGIGTVGCRAVEVISPVETEEEFNDRPLAIYIGGYGTEGASIMPMLYELPLNGLDVVGLGYPDSQSGILTEKFAQQVEQSGSLQAHAEMYKAVVKAYVEKYPGKPIQLWGQSTGALVIADMLSDPEFSGEISEAVLIGSAGAMEMSPVKQAVEYVAEVGALAGRIDRAPMYNYVVGLKDKPNSKEEIEAKKQHDVLMNRVWGEVRARTCKRQSSYDTAKVAEGGKIFFVTGGKDKTTRDFERFNQESVRENEKSGSNQWVVLHNKDGRHQDTNTMADILVPKILEAKKKLKER